MEKKALLDSLPPNLKMELMTHTHGTIISTLNFFDNKSWNFIWSAVPLLKALNFAKYEIVYREGDISDECKLTAYSRLLHNGGQGLLLHTVGSALPQLLAWHGLRGGFSSEGGAAC